MEMLKNVINRYSSLQIFFKSFFLLIIMFLIFFAVNLFISVKNKHESAYNTLDKEGREQRVNLQDTRVHNWSEIEEKTQN